MPGKDLEVVDGAVAGAWIEPALGGEGGAVSNQVPQVYEAYARLFHRAYDPAGNPVSWGEVAGGLGSTAHGGMQWHQIVGSSDSSNFTGSKWPGVAPYPGEMAVEELDRLCAVLAAHTADPGSCFFGICTINHSWMLDAVPAAERRPLLELPLGRDHLVLSGSLSAVEQIRRPEDVSGFPGILVIWFESTAEDAEPAPETDPYFLREAPSLIWPEDRSWFVVSEVDFDSTLVGGTRQLIDALVGAAGIEVYEVEPETLLTEFSDELNPVPEPSD